MLNTLSSVSVREYRIQYLCDPQWFRDTASRGPTTIVAPESQFRTCPSDHGSRTPQNPLLMLNTLSSVSVRESRIQYLCDPQWFRDTASRGPTTIVAPESQFRTCPSDHGIQLAVGPQQLRLRNHNFGLTHRTMVKRLATSPHDPLGITDSACKNQSVMVSVQYGPFNTYIPIRSTTIDSIGYPRTKASGESSTTKHRLLHASGPHPIPPPNDPN
ncbi:tetraspanin-15 [Dorcoceras hygrometricum]|uniref:Tetraspanin-15 n=1 Tax=Dorcoceras hygrometricum TaxID=472368 RepID=A0A2Z7D5N4_9LAMI|nr:tetraspanin-15 [Dorcoceras hygrometricum]